MGIFSKVLSGVEVVAGAALIASGVGVLAGAMLIASGLHGMGVIGGSIGKFMDSGLGKGLMGAVSLGSAAYAMYGASALTAASSEAMAADAEAGATGNAAETSLNAVSSANDAMQTSNSFLTGVGASQDVSAMADPSLGAVSGATPQSLAAVNAPATANIPVGPGAAAEQASQAQTAATQAENANPAASNVAAGGGGGGGPGQGPGIGGATKLQAPADSGATGASVPPPAAGAADAGTTPSAQDLAADADAGKGGAGAGTPSPDASQGGIFNKLGSLLNTRGGAAAIQAGGSLVGGLGQGMAEKQAMEQQLAAANWGNTQWANQGQADKAVAAAARPISIPNGYLQRAQQVRAMMGSNSGVPQPGGAPSGPVPPQALQGPVANAPVSANASQAVPRGGVI